MIAEEVTVTAETDLEIDAGERGQVHTPPLLRHISLRTPSRLSGLFSS